MYISDADKLILVVSDDCSTYRLNMYDDFVTRLKLRHPNVTVYGKGRHTYDPSKNIQEIVKNDLTGQEPDVIFLMDPQIAPSDFNTLASKVYVFISDSVSMNEWCINLFRGHTFKCEAVFYNYLYEADQISTAFGINRKIYWPCWAGSRYDYSISAPIKNLDFFMSGNITAEYSYRLKFKEIFTETDLNYVDNYMKSCNTKEDNDRYLSYLGSSRYSPHDGGVNGRMQGRFYESSFMKSVIISPDLGEEMRVNGFVHGTNCILVDRDMPREKVNDLLANIDNMYDWNAISQGAYSLVKERHTTDCRIDQFLNVVLND